MEKVRGTSDQFASGGGILRTSRPEGPSRRRVSLGAIVVVLLVWIVVVINSFIILVTVRILFSSIIAVLAIL